MGNDIIQLPFGAALALCAVILVVLGVLACAYILAERDARRCRADAAKLRHQLDRVRAELHAERTHVRALRREIHASDSVDALRYTLDVTRRLRTTDPERTQIVARPVGPAQTFTN